MLACSPTLRCPAKRVRVAAWNTLTPEYPSFPCEKLTEHEVGQNLEQRVGWPLGDNRIELVPLTKNYRRPGKYCKRFRNIICSSFVSVTHKQSRFIPHQGASRESIEFKFLNSLSNLHQERQYCETKKAERPCNAGAPSHCDSPQTPTDIPTGLSIAALRHIFIEPSD